MKTLITVIAFITFNIVSTFSQKEYYNWDFHGPNVITFNTPDGEPAILMKSIMPDRYINSADIMENCATISDSNGKFLLSTNGHTIYSYFGVPDSLKHNNLFTPLNGFFSCAQGVLIVKQPGFNSNYYIFTTGANIGIKEGYPRDNYELGYNYSIVDISKNNGQGEIIEINKLISAPSIEKITAVKHANGKDVWIIIPKFNTNRFNVYLLSEEGLNLIDFIISSAGSIRNLDNNSGFMKTNLKGNLLANVVNIKLERVIELMSFDNLSGRISFITSILLDSLPINITGSTYGIEFSPDDSKLYVSFNGSPSKIMQLDITNFESNYIIKNAKTIISSPQLEYSFGALQIAPNGKIYIARMNFLSKQLAPLAVINKPNLGSDSCHFSLNGTKFTTNRPYSAGLPNFVRGLFDFDVKIAVKSLCLGDDLVLTAQATPDITVNKYTWTLPDGSERTGKTITIPNANQSHEGLYKVKVDINSTLRYDSVNVEFHPLPIAKISGKLSFCKNSSTTLSAYRSSAYNYLWSTGETTYSIIVKKEGEYHLTVENEFGCKSYDTVYVTYSDDLTFNFVGGDKLCTGDTLLLGTDLVGDDYIYDWSNGETTPEILVTRGGKYILKVRTEAGCEGVDSITIQEFEKPEVAFEKSHYRLCEGEILTIKPIEIYPVYTYLWSDGIAEPERTFTDNTQIFLVASAENGCADTAYIKVEFLEMPVSSILADRTEACFGEKIILKSENFNPEFSYLWSTGETTESITVTESSIYKLFVTNGNLCSDTTEIEVKIHDDLALELMADRTNLCFDDSTKIYTANTYTNYLWSTGETTPIITVKNAGIFQLIVKNEFGCADTAEIEITKYDANIEFDKEKILFGELCVGDSQMENLKLTIQTETEFTISNISTTSNSFEIVNYNSLLKSYTNGEIINIEIKFNPQDAGIFVDELVISSTEPCEFIKSIPISASAKQVLEFSFGEHYSVAGQTLEIPLLGQIKCPAPQNLTTDYEIEVVFDKEYFSPESVKFGQLISNQIVGNERIIKIKADGDFSQVKSEINVIYGKALLGRTESSQIRIEDVKFSKHRYFPEYINGSLNVDGCVNDITTIQMFAPTKMTISPNPTDGELKVSIGTQEQGSFRLVVFDVQGSEVFRTEFSKSDKTFEQKDYNINTQNLGNGIYTIHLTAPWTLLREQVVVVR